MANRRIQLLLCYANEARASADVDLRDEIFARLSLLRRSTIDIVDVNKPPLGVLTDDWERACLETADIVILLVSHHFIDTPYWDSYVPKLVARFDQGAVKLVPVLVSDIGLDGSALAGRSTLPAAGRNLENVESRGRAIRDIVSVIRSISKTLVEAAEAANDEFRPRRLLLAFSNPRIPGHDTNIGVGAERERILAELDEAEAGRRLQRSELWATNLARLVERIDHFEPDLIHIGMHIDSSGDLLFADLDNCAIPVSPDQLWQALSSCSHQAKALVLNACNSALFGLASQGLFEHVIAMVGRVGALGALDFSTGFYRSIGRGQHIRWAYWDGVAHERQLARTRWCTPVYLHDRNSPPA